MALVADILLLVLATGLLVPVLLFSVECLAALLPARRQQCRKQPPRPSIIVLIPAHNEEPVIESTILSLLPQLDKQDRIVIVADNCSDGTAVAARRAGATVVERHDLDRRGKGYALAHGVDCLRGDPPDVLVLLDADTLPGSGAITTLARAAHCTGRPVQAVYLLDSPPDAGPRDVISCFAFMVKNLVRPLGLARLGLPCPLTGSGIALPWPVAEAARFGGGSIVEDMQLGVDMAIAGHPPHLCPEARVRGRLPKQRAAAASQRTRWEHGHIETLLKQTPCLLLEALKQRRLDLLFMALDLSVPPLSLLCLLWAGATAVAGLGAALGATWVPTLVLGVSGAMLAGSVLLAWSRYARGIVPLRTLIAIPLYVSWKLPLYLAFLVRRQRVWVRTERDAGSDPPADGTSQ